MAWLGWFGRKDTTEQQQLTAWRAAWTVAAGNPTRPAVSSLRRQLVEIGIDDEDHEIEREMLEGLEELIALKEQLADGGAVSLATGHKAVGTDRCYFSAPATLPDDPAQPAGTLLLTDTRAIFVGGARALTIPWHIVGSWQRQHRDLFLLKADRQDLHRIRCNTYGDALRAGAFAQALIPRRRV
jgi:hypothetical protein